MKKLLLFILTLWIIAPIYSQSAAKPRDGFLLKGGLWGLGGSFHTELEDKYFIDDLVFGSHLNLGWNEGSQFYLLNPIGIEYYMGGVGPGSLLFGLDFRGFPSIDLTGFNEKYDYISISSGALGIHNADLDFKNIDFVFGYQMAFNQFLITPKFSLRNFRSDFSQSGVYLGENYGLYRQSEIKSSTWVSYLGATFEFVINQMSTVYMELGFTSPILGQFGDFIPLNSLSYNDLFLYNGGGGVSIITDGKQEITGTLFDLGYQHSFGGGLGLRAGYRTELLKTSYPGYTHVMYPIGVSEIITDMAFYQSDDTTEFKSLYVMVTYQF